MKKLILIIIVLPWCVLAQDVQYSTIEKMPENSEIVKLYKHFRSFKLTTSEGKYLLTVEDFRIDGVADTVYTQKIVYHEKEKAGSYIIFDSFCDYSSFMVGVVRKRKFLLTITFLGFDTIKRKKIKLRKV
jgi:hypothetical protein